MFSERKSDPSNGYRIALSLVSSFADRPIRERQLQTEEKPRTKHHLCLELPFKGNEEKAWEGRRRRD
jgi:hypothetical protein